MENLEKTETLNHQQSISFEDNVPDKAASVPKQNRKAIHFDQEIYENYQKLGSVTIKGIEYKFQYSNNFRFMAYEEFGRFLNDIGAKGILVEVVSDENNNILDGKHRMIAGAILGITDIPFNFRPNLINEEKHDIAKSLNVCRRHLSKEERDAYIITLRQKGKSYTQIGEELGVSIETARRGIIKATSSNVGVGLPRMTIGKDGKQRLASIERKKSPSIHVNSIGEADRAVQACLSAGEAIPNKAIDLKRLERIGRQTKTNELRQQHCDDVKTGTATLLVGDFKERAKEIADESVDIILTDPSYAKEDLPIWNDLGELAKRVLKPSGILLSYSGNLYLPQIFEMVGQHMEYLWMFAIYHSNGNKLVPSVNVHQAWKPVIAYIKPPKNKYWRPFADMVSGGKEKEHHDWQQAVDEAKYYLSHLCPPNAVVLDPMMGSGTSIIAAMQLGFNATGIEIDPAAYATAQERIKQTENIKAEGSLNV